MSKETKLNGKTKTLTLTGAATLIPLGLGFIQAQELLTGLGCIFAGVALLHFREVKLK